ncbi:MAG: gephyrin-like molybdotransferase Glp [Bacillota bacterium]
MKLMRATDPEDVMKIIDDNFPALETVKLPLEQAGGRVISESITSPEDVPGFDRSTVDGYAVAGRETFGASESIPTMLECIGEVLMGQPAPSIKKGQCCQVHTGGMLPEGADAVVMVEDTDITGNMIQFFRQVAPAENVIHRGEDLRQGDTALLKGHKLRAPEIGMLASLGITEVKTHRRPIVGFFSSGDELVDYHNATLERGKIRDSNAPALLYLAEQCGANVKYGGILPDQLDVFLENSRKMLKETDLLVFSGGSSVGSRDYTARTMEELGKPGLLVEGISIQPGKPTLIANCGGKPVLGLPGHPVSALNIFAKFGRAIIEKLAGQSKKPYQPSVKAILTRNIASRSGRNDYVRIKLETSAEGIKAVPVFGRSGMLRTLAEADGLLEVPAEKEGLSEGEIVEVKIWE